MKYLILLLVIIEFLISTDSISAEIYRWVDKNGNVFYSDSPPPYGSFKKEKVEDEVDRSIEKTKKVEKRSDIDEREKLDQKIQIQIDYQKKTKAIRDYEMMRDDLEIAREKYQKKYDYLKEKRNSNWPGSSTRHDINNEIERLNRDYQEEIKKIKKLYGYWP